MPAPGKTWTFAANKGRHNWLRLTPAYSVDLVERLIETTKKTEYILDPFAGSGTTAIAAAERGIRAESWDINPFLLWLAQCKSSTSPFADTSAAKNYAQQQWQAAMQLEPTEICQEPAMHHIDGWWSTAQRLQLRRLKTHLQLADRTREHSSKLTL